MENHNDDDEGHSSPIVDDVDTGRVFNEQTTMKRATCCRSLDGDEEADLFNSKCKYSIRNAETSDMKKKL